MNKPGLDELLEQLEEARDAGRSLAVEDLCADQPELLEPLKQRWERLQQFDDRFGTRRESTADIEEKLSRMPERLEGDRLVMQSELHLQEFHDRGGLADVYRATDGEIAREVAVKLLRFDRQLPANMEDFKRESQIIGRMNHPGIVSIHGAGETIDGRPFYAMPFLDGGNLRSKIASYHREHRSRVVDAEKEFRDLIYRLASACKTIAYAHSRGIVHRDLKSENILLGKYGETLVIDWGCAGKVDRDERFKLFGERTLHLQGVDDSTTSKGLTLRYASPEQLHGAKELGPESDIYSLGGVLYLMLTGQSPLETEPDEQVRKRVLAGQVPPPDSLKAGVPRALAAICSKAMSVDPAERYENALAMADDLERYLSDESVSACRTSLGLQMARIVRRNRTASLLMLATLLVASLLLSAAFAGQSLFARKADASAKQRLRMAATLAANVGGYEINRRIELLEREASSPELKDALLDIEADPANRDGWLPVQNLIYEFRDELVASGVQLESMYLTDATGTQIARAPKTSSVGKNFAFRHYFHGLQQDLDPHSTEYQQNPPAPAKVPVISNAYVSTNRDPTGEFPIKTSFSVPVLLTNEAGQERVIGRLGMSLRINHLAVFDRLAELSLDGVLIETRDYAWGSTNANGIILDRIRNATDDVTIPVNSVLTPNQNTEDQVKDSMPRLDVDALSELMSQANGQSASLISNFYDPSVSRQARDAAVAPLTIPNRTDLSTGWTILFMEAEPAE